MSRLLATLESPLSQKCALAVIDTHSGIQYIQIDSFPSFHRQETLRDFSIYGDHVLVVTQCSLRRYLITSSPPFFRLQEEVVLPEWILGGGLQANLYSIYISRSRETIFVGNNQQASIDLLSFDGELKQRRYLWDICPALFVIPEELGASFSYGQIRNIVEDAAGRIFVTIALCMGREEGVVLDYDSGEIVIDKLHHPSGGVLADDSIWMVDSKKGELGCYPLDGMAFIPSITGKVQGAYSFNMRGLAQDGQTVYCGICDFFAPPEKQPPPFLAGFEQSTGRQVEKTPFVDLEEFRLPRIFSLSPIPEEVTLPVPSTLRHFRDGQEQEIVLFSPPPEGNKKHQVADAPLAIFCPDDIMATRYCLAPVPEEKVISIQLENVSLCYRRNARFWFSKARNLRERKEFWAVRDLSFTVYENETVALIGRNGSGKSTTSMMISGALKPDQGAVTTFGKTQLLALGIGFRPQMTGRENVMISGTILGLSRKEIRSRMEEIQEFAELGDFFDEPISTYSAGMKSRLGFAVSTAVQPDILILDEVMSTGDAAFRNKANKRMEEMRERTKTVIVVSHSPAQVRELCSRVIWLEQGRLLMDGKTEAVLPVYEEFCRDPEKWLADHS